ncbi:MAG: cellulase family glycosylhydrolase [Lachnospiraceae bacterium]|nr:cellulase family glycosylhydrolase [Lachnospiraceae bacterium]
MILFINACVRKGSRTGRLAHRLLHSLREPVTELKLEDIDFPKTDEEFLNKRDRLIAEKQFDADEFRLARQFADADRIVIAAPFWDLSFPAALKAYFEQINVLGITFVYTPEGIPKGLCKADKLYYVTTAGGTFFPEEFGYGYVKALAQNFYGIREVSLIKALGLDIDGADPEGILKACGDEYISDPNIGIDDKRYGVPEVDELRAAVLKNSEPDLTGSDPSVLCTVDAGSSVQAGTGEQSTPTPAQIMAADMGLGFNLGNSFDAVAHPGSHLKGVDSELAWFNPKTTKEMIAAIKKEGFKTLRLPVSWHNHVTGPEDTIDPAWMARIREVVDWCIAEDLYVILNTHHDIHEGFLLPDNAHIARSEEFMHNVWKQIAREMSDVSSNRLLFESMNEIRVPHAAYEWTPDYNDPECCDAMENVNRLNRVFLDTVRASGGENAERILVIPGYSTSTEGACWDGFRLPEDTVPGRLIVAAHIYSPAHFTFYLKEGANITEFDLNSRESTDPVDERLMKLYNRFVANGIPVNIDEFGTVDKNNDADRIRCLAYTLAKATQLHIRCCYWDNGVFISYGNGMAVFDRNRCIFPNPEPVEAMLRGIRAFE